MAADLYAAPRPVLCEDSGGYRTAWYCDPPALGTSFIVTRQSWVTIDGASVRNVFEYDLIETRGQHG
jgi:hypothetical protein